MPDQDNGLELDIEVDLQLDDDTAQPRSDEIEIEVETDAPSEGAPHAASGDGRSKVDDFSGLDRENHQSQLRTEPNMAGGVVDGRAQGHGGGAAIAASHNVSRARSADAPHVASGDGRSKVDDFSGLDLSRAISEELDDEEQTSARSLDMAAPGPNKGRRSSAEILLDDVVGEGPLNPFADEGSEENIEIEIEDSAETPTLPPPDMREPAQTSLSAEQHTAQLKDIAKHEVTSEPVDASLDVDAFLADILADESPSSALGPIDDSTQATTRNAQQSFTPQEDKEGPAHTQVFAPEPEVPALVISELEPPAQPSDGAEALRDPATLRTLEKLAGKKQDHDATHEALMAALNTESFDPTRLPNARSMLLGLADILMTQGVSAEDITAAIMARTKL